MLAVTGWELLHEMDAYTLNRRMTAPNVGISLCAAELKFCHEYSAKPLHSGLLNGSLAICLS
jgi:hypothetical protein